MQPQTETNIKDSGSASPELSEESLEELLYERCEYWKKILRLQDWNVSIEVRRKHEMADPNCIGCIRIFDEGKDAKIHLLSPVDLVTVEEGFIDHEELNYDITLVHELLHLHFQAFAEDDTTYKGMCQEQVINILSRALVGAYQAKAKLVHKEPAKEHGHYL